MPVHGMGTALFIVNSNGNECILVIHNGLLCHGETTFNLLSVSQTLRSTDNSIVFKEGGSQMTLKHKKKDFIIDLREEEGLYGLSLQPLCVNDKRNSYLTRFDVTPDHDPKLFDETPSEGQLKTMGFKAPSVLGAWTRKVLWIGTKAIDTKAYDSNLRDFCNSYFSPSQQFAAKRTYQVDKVDDMADLSVRFMGIGNDRLEETLKRSRGLTPCKRGEKVARVPPHNFPQGKWARGKVPKVSKGKVKLLHRASIAEVIFTDTFETDDKTYRYGQAFVDYRSRYGDIIPIRSRKKVGWAFGEFCCRHFTPLILVRDNIAENIGGDLAEECHRRGVQSAFICPYTPEQDQAEGYLGRVTTMASFAMVYSGAPLFMWIWCIQCAVFINNITTTYFSKEQTWATPYELEHGEPYPDASVVVPFGCGALVRLRNDKQEKFKPKCALLIFIHYAMRHPLYTYALYSPKTKRILFRQDVIFLTNVFPMREARMKGGMNPEGEEIIAYRAARNTTEDGEDELSFGNWTNHDKLPPYQDHVEGFTLTQPHDDTGDETVPRSGEWPIHTPHHPAFGPGSVVKVPVPGEMMTGRDSGREHKAPTDIEDDEPRRSGRNRLKTELTVNSTGEQIPPSKRRVQDRWFYETVPAILAQVASHCTSNGLDSLTMHGQGVDVGVQEEPMSLPAQTVLISAHASSGTDRGLLDENKPMDRNNGTVQDFPNQSTSIISQSLIPKLLGPLNEIPLEHLDGISNDEDGACFLQGTLFLDEDLGWCMISGWGVECGLPIVFYLPVLEMDLDNVEEHHASLMDVLSWIKGSPQPPNYRGYKSSRALRRSLKADNSCWFVRTMASRAVRTLMGTMVVNDRPRVKHKSTLLATKTLRKILKMQESLFKYGTYVPRNDKEADKSPESVRWKSGRRLEWIRLKTAKTFESHWTWETIQKKYPDYRKDENGNMFYIYDYKYSGEHRVRLVFNGARQSPNTYTETYAPTVRAESVRLFHVYAVEYGFTINQFDVPQAFLRSDADCDIFVYPPRGDLEFPGQILKLSKMLYGSKQAAALWYRLLDTFLKSLGFISSYFDPCFYRRPIVENLHDPSLAQSDAIIILHVDDMRVAAHPTILQDIHDRLFAEFQITTSDTGRFLGMDTSYDLEKGVLIMHMATYIDSTVLRFKNFDTTVGVPFRELVGCLLWIVLNIIGPELLRVKDLAKRSNDYSSEDYAEALKVLTRISDRRNYGITYKRGGAGREYVPACSRPEGGLDELEIYASAEEKEIIERLLRAEDKYEAAVILQPPNAVTYVATPYSIGHEADFNELEAKDLYKLDAVFDDEKLDIIKTLKPTNRRFTMIAYSDASFATGISKQSVSGYIILLNGIPWLFGSLKQTIVVDSTCSAEYVAASICCKQILEAENMVQFLEFTCPKPYKMYTDSQACLKIATSNSTLGKVRHLEIRYHLVRCLIISGDVVMEYCITEEMLADLFTKIVAGAQEKRLTIRFYNDCVVFSNEAEHMD